jgi:hypothetical protein
MNTMETRIAGIPCMIKVGYFNVVKGDSRADNPDDYRGYTDFEFTVCDRRGRPAPWLEKKMTSKDEADIQEQYENEMRDLADDY